MLLLIISGVPLENITGVILGYEDRADRAGGTSGKTDSES